MSQLRFTEDQQSVRRTRSVSQTSSMAGKLIAWKIVKTETQANIILLLLSAICVITIIFNLLSLTEKPVPPPLIETETAR